MAAEIDMSNNRANIAYIGEKPWHLLGTELEDGATIEQWMVAAGLEWKVEASPTYMQVGDEYIAFDDRKILYRGDTKAPLSVVGKDFKVVQPQEVVEFFRDLVEKHDMKLSTAGSLFGGRRFWALAELGKDFEVNSGDKVIGNLLLTTAVDGSLNTTAKFVSTRVVCQNTLNVALKEGTKNLVKVSHKSQWDPERAKMDLGLIDKGWFEFMDNIKKMSNKKVTDKQAKDFYKDLIFPTNKDATKADERKVDKLMDLYKSGTGADMSYGSFWGIINSITEMYTHGSGKRAASHQFWDSFYAGGAEMKDKAYEKILAEIA